MISTIKNNKLEIAVNSLGAELSSIRSLQNGLEYLWQGDPSWWEGQSPVLFPIVGALEEDTLHIGDSRYTMKQHGFARESEFELIEGPDQQSGNQENNLNEHPADSSLVYRLISNPEIKKQYPYEFELMVSFLLEDNALINRFEVSNTDAETIYFSIGGHPGFNVPLHPDEAMSDYILRFEKPETVERRLLVDGLLDGSTEQFLNKQQEIEITPTLFDKAAIILDGLRSDSLALKSTKSGVGVTVEFPRFPYLGIWAKPGGAPFVCIEPWYGIASTRGKKTDVRQKEGVISLPPKKTFQCEYRINISAS